MLVSMLSMLVQVRRGGGGGARRGGIGFNKCIHFVFGFKTFNFKAFFSFELRCLFMMIGMMNHLP